MKGNCCLSQPTWTTTAEALPRPYTGEEPGAEVGRGWVLNDHGPSTLPPVIRQAGEDSVM